MLNLDHLYNNKYKFTLKEAHHFYNASLKDVYFSDKYFECVGGFCTIKAGYSWDGCTVVKDYKETYFASLEHDCLYQYGKKLGIKRKICDLQFYRTMCKWGFKKRKLYYLGVRIFGWLFY